MTKSNFQPAIRITWGVILLCLVSLSILIKTYLIDNNFNSNLGGYLVYSIPLLISAFVFIVLLYNLKRAYSEGQKDIDKGNCIIHWIYEEEEWAKFNSAEWIKIRKKCIWIPLGFLAFFYLLGLIDPEFSASELTVPAVALTLFFTSLSAALLFYNYALYRRTIHCPREVFINQHGFLYGGYYNTWEVTGTRLAGIKLIPGDIQVLEFDVKVWGKYGENSRPFRIPVPKGCESEAKKVIAEITTYQKLPLYQEY